MLTPQQLALTSQKPGQLAELKNAFLVFKHKVNSKGAHF